MVDPTRKLKFLSNVRLARNLFVHPRLRDGGPRADPTRVPARSAIWLTPRSVRDFTADDFPELGPNGQAELGAAVAEFLAVANAVAPTQPPTEEQVAAGAAAFENLLRILERQLPLSEESLRIREALGKLDFPEWVVNWDYELDTDSVGDPAVWLVLYIDETTAPWKDLGRVSTDLQFKIRPALSAAGIRRDPYNTMRGASEHKAG